MENMLEVGIRALKQNASAVVAEAAAGEAVTIRVWDGVPTSRLPSHPAGVRWLHGVLSDHDRSCEMGGRPCIRGLRVTVGMILGQLAAGRTVEDVLEDYPYLEREDVLAALDYAAAMAEERGLPVSRPA